LTSAAGLDSFDLVGAASLGAASLALTLVQAHANKNAVSKFVALIFMTFLSALNKKAILYCSRH
jgi:hypothetical protein